MDDPNQLAAKPQEVSVEALAKATRFALCMVVLVLTYFPFRASFAIPAFGKIFEDMLGAGSQLPMASQYILGAAPLVMVFNGALLATAFGMLFVRNIPRAIYILGVLGIVAVVDFVVVFQAMFMPLTEIVKRMQGGAPGM